MEFVVFELYSPQAIIDGIPKLDAYELKDKLMNVEHFLISFALKIEKITCRIGKG